MSHFSQQIITWQKQYGRHDLPWQNTQDPYAIWVSEIMLQQTLVAAVIDYYQRFMTRFPNIAALSSASQEEVLQHWSGLGYYSRARNLHNAAQTIMDHFNGIFPNQFDDILKLTGIGRSTAAAISTFALNAAQPILDGNVKRVFARHFLVEGWPSTPKVQAQLWQLAEQHMPNVDMIAYTQGLMDLGATRCTRSKPKCLECPIQSTCGAYLQNRTTHLPTPKPRKTLPQKECVMMLISQGNEILLEKRPATGIWGGLWSLPEIATHEIATEVAQLRYGLTVEPSEPLEMINHVFTHFKLAITPQPLILMHKPTYQPNNTIWLSVDDAISAAIPTPIRTILNRIKNFN
jgi:A/G-specific adenine glycosylase